MARTDVLVDADWVEAHLDDPKVVLVEVDEDTAAYDKNHIRGAVRIDWKHDLQDPVRRDFVNKEQFEELLSREGHRQRRHRRALRRQQQLVRGLRLLVLQALRPRRRQAARRRPQEVGARLAASSSTTCRRAPATTYTRRAGPDDDPRVPRRGRRGDRQAEPRRRPLARRVHRQAARAGAPAAGAVAARRATSRPRRTSRGRKAANDDGTFRSDDELTELYADEGVDFGKDTIAYCRIGERSAHTWFVLHELLGQPNVKNYDGSWTEYGSLVGVPIEKDV